MLHDCKSIYAIVRLGKMRKICLVLRKSDHRYAYKHHANKKHLIETLSTKFSSLMSKHSKKISENSISFEQLVKIGQVTVPNERYPF